MGNDDSIAPDLSRSRRRPQRACYSSTVVVFDEFIGRERAWTRESLASRDVLVPVPDACVAELDAVVAGLASPAEQVAARAPEASALPACRALMARVQAALCDGPGHVILDRLPVERYGLEGNRAVAGLLSRLLGPVVSQTWKGTYLYDVKDSGKALGYGVRRSVTNLAQPFHTDGPWLWMPPAFVGLLCVQPGHAGGLSRVSSLLTAHNAMRSGHPDLLPRLYGAFSWDRQAEHGPDDPRVAAHPVYAAEGGMLLARYYEDYVVKGHALAGAPLDAEGAAALEALRAIVDRPEHWVEFRLERGQFQFLNNRQVAHCRTAFQDEPDWPRHMVRVWVRDEGTPHLEGRAVA
jgi:alpha-ketoglutarate-dependent taurine dioxygenase